ncbi:major facilitator superfamily transporter [Stagonosporopsis vannaccii]|nr:major facilitator superfamily transporter [Stagonosporopsis vannaccii]
MLEKDHVEHIDESDTTQVEIEKKLRHKFDRRVLPLGVIIYLAAQIDRTNMSNAVVLGLRADADLTGNRFNIALSLFFVTYIVFELPANMMCKRLGPRLWLSLIILGFGIVTFATAFVTSYPGLLVCRTLLGVFESGVQPGLMFAYAQFYRRHELASRWGIKAAGASCAGAFGGLLGGGLGNIPQVGMLVRWRWIFVVEGALTVILAGVVYWTMPHDIASASFLTEEEKQVGIGRIAEENKMGNGSEDLKPWQLLTLKRGLWNLNTQLVSLGLIMSLLSLTALSLFMVGSFDIFNISFANELQPSLLRSMGYSPTHSQLLTVPPYVVAAIVCTSASFLSDRLHTRGLIIIALTPLTILGFLLMALLKSTTGRYIALFLPTAAAFTCSPLLLAWVVGNSAGPSVRAVVSAYAVGEANIGGLIATWTYLPADAPLYVTGHWINFGGSCILLAVALVTTFYLRWENALRAKGGRDNRLADPSESWKLGHRHPEYRYTA